MLLQWPLSWVGSYFYCKVKKGLIRNSTVYKCVTNTHRGLGANPVEDLPVEASLLINKGLQNNVAVTLVERTIQRYMQNTKLA